MSEVRVRATIAVTGPDSPLNSGHDFRVINDWARQTPWLHGAMTAYAGKGPVLFLILLIAGWWIARRSGNPRRMALALWAGLAAVAAVGINQPIVHHVREQRPYATLPHALLLVGRSADFSFPSDHATMAGAVAAGLLLVSWRLGLLASVGALLLAFSRVYVGAHWPRDVVAGLVLGAIVAIAGYLLVVPALARLVGWTAGTPLRLLVTTRPRERPTDCELVSTGRSQDGRSQDGRSQDGSGTEAGAAAGKVAVSRTATCEPDEHAYPATPDLDSGRSNSRHRR